MTTKWRSIHGLKYLSVSESSIEGMWRSKIIQSKLNTIIDTLMSDLGLDSTHSQIKADMKGNIMQTFDAYAERLQKYSVAHKNDMESWEFEEWKRNDDGSVGLSQTHEEYGFLYGGLNYSSHFISMPFSQSPSHKKIRFEYEKRLDSLVITNTNPFTFSFDTHNINHIEKTWFNLNTDDMKLYYEKSMSFRNASFKAYTKWFGDYPISSPKYDKETDPSLTYDQHWKRFGWRFMPYVDYSNISNSTQRRLGLGWNPLPREYRELIGKLRPQTWEDFVTIADQLDWSKNVAFFRTYFGDNSPHNYTGNEDFDEEAWFSLSLDFEKQLVKATPEERDNLRLDVRNKGETGRVSWTGKKNKWDNDVMVRQLTVLDKQGKKQIIRGCYMVKLPIAHKDDTESRFKKDYEKHLKELNKDYAKKKGKPIYSGSSTLVDAEWYAKRKTIKWFIKSDDWEPAYFYLFLYLADGFFENVDSNSELTSHSDYSLRKGGREQDLQMWSIINISPILGSIFEVKPYFLRDDKHGKYPLITGREWHGDEITDGRKNGVLNIGTMQWYFDEKLTEELTGIEGFKATTYVKSGNTPQYGFLNHNSFF